MKCPVCHVKLIDYMMHLKAAPACRQELYDSDRILIIDGHEILEGTLYRERRMAGRKYWVRGLDVHGHQITVRGFDSITVAEIFLEREQQAYAARGGDPRRALRPRSEQRTFGTRGARGEHDDADEDPLEASGPRVRQCQEALPANTKPDESEES